MPFARESNMNTPSLPLTIVYKVVQVVNGAMYSVNKFITDKSGKLLDSEVNSERVIRYRLKHQVWPSHNIPALFVCPTLDAAHKVFKFFADAHHGQVGVKFYILRCYAYGVRVVNEHNIAADPAMPLDASIVSAGYKTTALCDWLIPIGIIKSK